MDVAGNIARQLIAGSENIDRMRREIDAVVRMILGLIKDYDIDEWRRGEQCVRDNFGYEHTSFISPGARWEITLEKGGSLSVVCDLIGCVVRPGDKVTPNAYNSLRSGSDIRLACVQDVYESLPIFVEGVTKIFPNLKEVFRIFLNASRA